MTKVSELFVLLVLVAVAYVAFENYQEHHHQFATLGGTVVFLDASTDATPYEETKESARQ
jgi:hypothetical protein